MSVARYRFGAGEGEGGPRGVERTLAASTLASGAVPFCCFGPARTPVRSWHRVDWLRLAGWRRRADLRGRRRKRTCLALGLSGRDSRTHKHWRTERTHRKQRPGTEATDVCAHRKYHRTPVVATAGRPSARAPVWPRYSVRTRGPRALHRRWAWPSGWGTNTGSVLAASPHPQAGGRRAREAGPAADPQR